MLALVKLALRITTNAFDDEIINLIQDCTIELRALGVTNVDETDAQVRTAIIAYCKWQFGDNENSEKWREIYENKLAMLKTQTGHTDWGENGQKHTC